MIYTCHYPMKANLQIEINYFGLAKAEDQNIFMKSKDRRKTTNNSDSHSRKVLIRGKANLQN